MYLIQFLGVAFYQMRALQLANIYEKLPRIDLPTSATILEGQAEVVFSPQTRVSKFCARRLAVYMLSKSAPIILLLKTANALTA